jgi:hypothetical protein
MTTDLIATYAVSLALIGLSGGMLDWHRRSWRRAQLDAAISDRDRRFARSQYRRRLQASGMIGLLGAAIAVWPIIPPRPIAMATYVAALGLACGCMMLLAAIDLWATRQNMARSQMEQLAAQLKMARDLPRERTPNE